MLTQLDASSCIFWETIAPQIGHLLIAVAALIGTYAGTLRSRGHVRRLELEALANDENAK